MGGKSKVSPQLPFSSTQATTNTYAPFSIADSPEAKDFLSTPLDFGSGGKDLNADFNVNVGVDPGVGRRTAQAEKRAGYEWDSAFSGGPSEYRKLLRDSQLRDIRGQGAYEAQQAEHLKNQGELARRQAQFGADVTKAGMDTNARSQATMAELERRRLLLPQFLQTGGSGSSSGYNTQLVQQPSFLSNFGSGLGSGLAGALPFI